MLSEREIEVLQLVAAGYSNKLICKSLDICERTAKLHVQAICEVLNIRREMGSPRVLAARMYWMHWSWMP